MILYLPIIDAPLPIVCEGVATGAPVDCLLSIPQQQTDSLHVITAGSEADMEAGWLPWGGGWRLADDGHLQKEEAGGMNY